MITSYYTSTPIVCINSTHRAADDVVLERVPTNVPHTRFMVRQSGDHGARQDIINWMDTQKTYLATCWHVLYIISL